MDQLELETLIVRLVGDVDQYLKSMDTAVKHTEEAAEKIEHSAHEIEGFHKKLEEFGEKAEKTLLRVGIAIGAWEAFEKFEKTERSIGRLEATLEANERKVHSTMSSYNKFTNQLKDTYAVSGDVTRSLLKQAENFDLTGKAAERAVRNSLALGAANDVDAASAMRFVQAMEKGDVEGAMMFARMLPSLRHIKDETELTERYTRQLAAGEKILGNEANDAGGKIERMKMSLGAITRQIGEQLAPFINLLVTGTKAAVDALNKMPPALKEVVVGVLAIVAAVKVLSVYMASPWAVALVGIGLVVAAVGRAKAAYAEFQTKIDEGNRKNVEALMSLVEKRVGAKDTKNEQVAALKEIIAEANAKALEAGGASPKDPNYLKREQVREVYEGVAKGAGEKLKALTDPAAATLKATEAVKAYVKELKTQTDARGLDEYEVKMHELALLGLTAAQREEVVNLQEADRLIKMDVEARDALIAKQKDAADSAGKLVGELTDQVATFGMSKDAAEEFHLSLKGVDGSTLLWIRDLKEQVAAQDEWNSMLDDAADLTDKYRDPQAKLADQQAYLNDLYDSGLISLETYDAAMKDLVQHTQELNTANLQAVRVGSAADVALNVQQFRQFGRGPNPYGPQSSGRSGTLGSSSQIKFPEEKFDKTNTLLQQLLDAANKAPDFVEIPAAELG